MIESGGGKKNTQEVMISITIREIGKLGGGGQDMGKRTMESLLD